VQSGHWLILFIYLMLKRIETGSSSRNCDVRGTEVLNDRRCLKERPQTGRSLSCKLCVCTGMEGQRSSASKAGRPAKHAGGTAGAAGAHAPLQPLQPRCCRVPGCNGSLLPGFSA
jgi:hypothetical protein